MALQFNNGVTNEAVTYDGSASPFNSSGSSAISMGLWVYRDTESAAANEYIANAFQNSVTFGGASGFRCGTDDNYRTYSQANGDIVLTAAPTGSWVYIAFTTTDVFAGKAYYGTTPGALTELAGTAAVSTTLAYLRAGCLNDGNNPFRGRIAHWRMWKAVLTEAQLETESNSATAVVTSGLYAAYEFANNSGTYLNDSSGNNRHLTASNVDFATNYIAGPLAGVTLTTKLKLLAHSSAASATGVAGVVYAAPTGGNISGARIGEFTGKSFLGPLESGQAVLKVDVADFGGNSLTTSDTPVALVRNSTNTTGIVSCTVIQE
jgi:hypothetical protein